MAKVYSSTNPDRISELEDEYIHSNETTTKEITDDDRQRLNYIQKLIKIENSDKREDTQRNMAWFALAGMLLYPFAVVLASWLNLESCAKILGEMAGIYFVSVAGIIMAFFGFNTWDKIANKHKSET